MIIYHYDEQGFYQGQSTARVDPLTGDFMLPRNSTLVAPVGTLEINHNYQWNGETWDLVELPAPETPPTPQDPPTIDIVGFKKQVRTKFSRPVSIEMEIQGSPISDQITLNSAFDFLDFVDFCNVWNETVSNYDLLTVLTEQVNGVNRIEYFAQQCPIYNIPIVVDTVTFTMGVI